jgi:5'-nucleotidase (lipoprotein e(P4) family)
LDWRLVLVFDMYFSVWKTAGKAVKKMAPYMVSITILMTVALSKPDGVQACPCNEIPKPAADVPAMDRVEGAKYIGTEGYRHEFDQAIAGARAACQRHLGEPNVAIVSDLDETLLDNSSLENQHAATNDEFKAKFRQWVAQGSAPTLKPTADFLAWARDNGYAIFFVTGRRERERRATIENLLRDKIAYDGLYLRANNDNRSAEDVKTDMRKDIEEQGFKIIVSIGDQYSDLYGGYAEDCEKLPNKMYYIP